MSNTLSKKYADLLLNNKIFVTNDQNPFTWTSGLVMPFYCDQRSILGNTKLRKQTIDWLKECLILNIPNYQSCALVGVVTAGVPWATMLAQELNLPLGYVRSQKKEHGKKNALEGNFPNTMPIILVEDLVSTAKSLNQAYQLLIEEQYQVKHALALFSYGFKTAKEQLEKISLPLTTLSNFKVLNQQLPNPLTLNTEQKNLFCENSL